MADPMDRGQQQIMCGRWTGSRRWPQGAEKIKDARLLCSEPERSGEAKIDRGSFQGQRSGTVFDQGSDFLSGAEIGLMDDTGFALNTRAFDDIVVEFVGLLLGDQGSHIG